MRIIDVLSWGYFAAVMLGSGWLTWQMAKDVFWTPWWKKRE